MTATSRRIWILPRTGGSTAWHTGRHGMSQRQVHRVRLAIAPVSPHGGTALLKRRKPAISSTVLGGIFGAPRIGDLGRCGLYAAQHGACADRRDRNQVPHHVLPEE